MNLLRIGFQKFASKDHLAGEDDLGQRRIYAFIKAKPKRLNTNLQYMTTFSLIDNDEIDECMIRIKSSIEYIQNTMGENIMEAMEMDTEEFCRKFNRYSKMNTMVLDNLLDKLDNGNT